IFSSVILSAQLLLNNNAWTDEYSLLSLLKGDTEKKSQAVNIKDTGALNSVFSPSSFLLTFTDGRLYYSATQAEGKALRTPFNETIQKAFQNNNAETVSEQEWQSALQKPGIYANYYVPVSIDAMSAFLGNSQDSATSRDAFDQIAICFDPVTSGAAVYLRDSSSNKQLRIPVDNTESLFSAFAKYESVQKQGYAYAFELNLDKKMDDASVQQNVLLDSYVLLPLDPMPMNVIRAESVSISDSTADEILPLFGHNPKIARKFTDNNGNHLFVNQESTLTINPETGFIEYAAEEGFGVLLNGDGSLSSNATGCGKLLDDLFKLFEIDPNVTLFINTPLTDSSKSDYTISFDYLFDGNRILRDKNSCEIQIKNGKIVHFKANIRNYTFVRETEPRHAIEILDRLYSMQDKDVLTVNKLYTGYVDEGGEISLTWKAGVQNSDRIITVE
ncbi:MAG: hypothetical protein IKJ55_01255, partial [Clostridia bacterium]|nr:hypothetical protein [Clostridia bacterium]